MGNSSINFELSDTPLTMNLGILNIWFCFIGVVIETDGTSHYQHNLLDFQKGITLYIIIFSYFSIYVVWEKVGGDADEMSFNVFLGILQSGRAP